MKLSDIAIKCHSCCVHFSPNNARAERLMKSQGYISLCLDCEEMGNED